MTFEGLAKALDGLQAAYHNGADIELGLRSLRDHGFSMAQLERMAALRKFPRIASVARRLIRDDQKAKEQSHADQG